MQEKLRAVAKQLLEEKSVQLVIGYGDASVAGETSALFVRRPEEAQKLVWNNRCFGNLAVYLTRPEVKSCARVAVVAKGCDARAIAVLLQEGQVARDSVHIIGIACGGVGEPPAAKCARCDVKTPAMYDTLVGSALEAAKDRSSPDVAEFEAKTREQRWEFWRERLSRCIKCYACRQVCPLCYCTQCIVEKNLPRWIDSSPHAKGNFAWHIHRAFHLAGRCVGCGECERVCPANIPLTLINRKLAKEVEGLFKYRPGYDIKAKPVLTTFNESDDQGFIS